MNTTSNHEFLLWVARRLMYKHKDDAKIVARLENIARELYRQAKSFEKLSQTDYSEVESMLK